MYKRFLGYYLLMLIPFAIPLWGNYRYLKNLQEYTPINILVQQQRESEQFCLYDTAVRGSSYDYKVQSFTHSRPDVVIVGSSTSMGFRERFFRKSFYNAGSQTISLSMLDALVHSLLDNHKPEIMLIGVDFWWFNDQYDSLSDYYVPPKSKKDISLRSLYLPFEWLLDEKIGFVEYLKIVLQDHDADQECRWGVAAKVLGRGFGPDGSYYYTDSITGKTPHKDPGFVKALEGIETGVIRHMYSQKASRRHIDKFEEILEFIRSKGVEPVPIFLPFPVAMVEAMKKQGKNYAYIDDAKGEFSNRGIQYFDFFDPRTIHSSDCEFIDSLHAGDVNVARMLQQIYRSSPVKYSFIDIDAVREHIAANKGLAMGQDLRITNQAEIDFLELGCKK